MFRLKIGISFIAALVLAVAAHADPVTFSLQNGTFDSGATMSGSIVVDTATGAMVSADLTYTLGGSSVTFDRTFYYQGSIPALYNVYFPLTIGAVVDGPGDPGANPPVVDEFDLIIPASTLVGYAGGLVCTDNVVGGYYCGGGVYSNYNGKINFLGDDVMATGSLVPLAAATPEPSEFALTFTGLALCAVMAFGRPHRVHAKQ